MIDAVVIGGGVGIADDFTVIVDRVSVAVHPAQSAKVKVVDSRAAKKRRVESRTVRNGAGADNLALVIDAVGQAAGISSQCSQINVVRPVEERCMLKSNVVAVAVAHGLSGGVDGVGNPAQAAAKAAQGDIIVTQAAETTTLGREIAIVGKANNGSEIIDGLGFAGAG